jgi:hypothetical protein
MCWSASYRLSYRPSGWVWRVLVAGLPHGQERFALAPIFLRYSLRKLRLVACWMRWRRGGARWVQEEDVTGLSLLGHADLDVLVGCSVVRS